jgi:hypothetical protein
MASKAAIAFQSLQAMADVASVAAKSAAGNSLVFIFVFLSYGVAARPRRLSESRRKTKWLS